MTYNKTKKWESRNFNQRDIMNHFYNEPIPLCSGYFLGLVLGSWTSFKNSHLVTLCCNFVFVFKLHQCASLFYYLDLRLSSVGVSLSQWNHTEFNRLWQAFMQECRLPDHQQDNHKLLKINRRILPKRHSLYSLQSHNTSHSQNHPVQCLLDKLFWSSHLALRLISWQTDQLL